jgi:hypothetical protein
MLTLIRQIAGSGRILFPLTVVLTANVTLVGGICEIVRIGLGQI